ncbi:hypothetical protein PAHAL_3G298700 [Panicum hallii]|uniref:Uncharacterized protein n=1 Tax=Panicum hallii TaxID=206008 RepID=A0A2S3HCF9_9POAL|nr:uncharacterized protein LOC112883921 [Panicum hallii]PAN19775.1 hypothetical protein PAHAL_3G298700 [Panicum hallii]
MGQGAAKAKQGGEEAAQKTKKKNEKKAHKSDDADALIEFMKQHYDDKVKGVTSFDEFYHAIYELIEMFCESRGQLQYRIPTKEELKKQYENAHPWTSGTANLTQEQFEKIAMGIVNMKSFTIGKAAMDIAAFLFGLPVCALLAKRIVPGLKAISDDIVIPAATSVAVVCLAKSNKL